MLFKQCLTKSSPFYMFPQIPAEVPKRTVLEDVNGNDGPPTLGRSCWRGIRPNLGICPGSREGQLEKQYVRYRGLRETYIYIYTYTYNDI